MMATSRATTSAVPPTADIVGRAAISEKCQERTLVFRQSGFLRIIRVPRAMLVVVSRHRARIAIDRVAVAPARDENGGRFSWRLRDR
jgi:hypothetical protein